MGTRRPLGWPAHALHNPTLQRYALPNCNRVVALQALRGMLIDYFSLYPIVFHDAAPDEDCYEFVY